MFCARLSIALASELSEFGTCVKNAYESLGRRLSDSDEKLEVAWTKDTYDLSENNGSLRDSHINRPAGVCDDVSYTSAATMGDVTVNEKDQAVDPHGG